MKKQDERSRIAMNIWTARAVPLILAAIVGYATYVLVVVLCVHYLLVKHDDHGAVIPILTIYFILFTMMTISFLRLVYVTTADPPYLPLGEAAKRKRKSASRSHTDKSEDGMSNGKYSEENGTGDTSADLRNDPDSPGLELYYTKDVFSCELDGRPRWCSECCNWKPDRAHHCSASGRCILKMDHFCPWVGGPVGENNFKFFIQFTGYTALYCLHLLVVMAIYIRRQKTSEGEKVNAQMAVILGLAAFFGLFTASMVGTALNYAIWNMTQVEKLGIKNRYHVLAVLITPGRELNPLSDEPPSHTEITYPLGAAPGQRQALHENSQPGQPAATAASRTQVSNSHPSEEPPTHTESSGIPLVNDSTVTTPPVSTEHKQLEGELAMKISTRDQRATRKFAVLKMKPGDNPWDLGSSMLNFQTVMGYNVLDWFLPIKRSPCCNHENQESHFAVGPRVEALKASYGLIDPLPIHASQDASDEKDKSSSSGGNHSHRTRKRRSRPMQPATKDGIVNGSNGEAANQTDALELQDLKNS